MPVRPEEWILAVGSIVICIGVMVLFGLLLRDTIRQQGRWGINFKSLAGSRCPICSTPLPTVRTPRSVSQMLWGGWTCAKCGCEIDKWGKVASRGPKELMQ